MGNIIDYVLEFGNQSFSEVSFKKEDALLLCQFFYLDFDKILNTLSEETVSVSELDLNAEKESLFSNPRYEKDNRELFEAVVSSKRYSDIKLCMYINRIEVENETQFAAVTMICPNAERLVIFRGTDENMVGWQEDFGLALKKPITGQMLSAKYLNDVSARFGGKLSVAGHSKGGNLSIYSSLCATDAVKERIHNIYCFDGPGFRKEFLDKWKYWEISDRIIKVIPKSSIVGMILDTDENSQVVKARQLGMAQHKIFNWVIEDGELVSEELSEQHELLVKSLNDWILSQSEEKLERFTDFLDHMLESTEADTTVEFTNDVYHHMLLAIKAATEIDDDTKEFLNLFLKSYFDIVKDAISDDVKQKVEEKVKRVMQGKLPWDDRE